MSTVNNPTLPDAADPNEEEIKLRYVVPWLTELGLDLSTVRAEMQFTIRLGRHTYRVDTKAQLKDKAVGRLDILLKHGGKNLCVLEAKREGHPIDDDDIEQACSYARLLNPIPPLAVVTDGSAAIFLDPLTMERIQSADLPSTKDRKPAIGDNERRAALAYFVTRSPAHMLALCSAQVDSRLSILRGTDTQSRRPYIDALYEPPNGLDAALGTFTRSQGRCFVAIAESGSGKTTWLCASAVRAAAASRPTFFFLGREIEVGILESMSDDLAWGTHQQLATPHAVRDLVDTFAGTPIVVFVDGLDDLPAERARGLIDGFLLRAPPDGIKLVFGCKPHVLPGLRNDDVGVATRLDTEILQTSSRYVVPIADRSEAEFRLLVARYERFYGIANPVPPAAAEDARRDPLLLRLAFEMAEQGTGQDGDGWLRALYETYRSRIVRHCAGGGALVESVLVCLTEFLFTGNQDDVALGEIRTALHLAAAEELPAVMFERDVLWRADRDGQTRIGFVRDRLRDIVMIGPALHWADLSAEKLRETVAQTAWSGVRLEALRTYYAIARAEHQRVLDEPLFTNAHAFLDLYERVLDTHFVSFRDRFAPGTRGPIGLVGAISLAPPPAVPGGIGLRGITGAQKRVVWIPVGDRATRHLGWTDVDLEMFRHGVSTIHWSTSLDAFLRLGGVASNVVTENEVHPQLKTIVKEGRLQEGGRTALLTERLLATWWGTIGAGIRGGGARPGFPLQLSEVHAHVVGALLEREAIEAAIAGDDPSVERRGSLVVVTRPPRGSTDVVGAVRARFGDGLFAIPAGLLAHSDRTLSTVLGMVRDLAACGVLLLEEPEWSRLPRDRTAEAKEELVCAVLRRYLDEYRWTVETNFPTLKESFVLYGQLPVRVYVRVDGDRADHLVITTCEAAASQSDSVVLKSGVEIGVMDRLVRDDTGEHRVLSQTGTSVDRMLEPSDVFLPFSGAGQYSRVRAAVYREIAEDLEAAVKRLRPDGSVGTSSSSYPAPVASASGIP